MQDLGASDGGTSDSSIDASLDGTMSLDLGADATSAIDASVVDASLDALMIDAPINCEDPPLGTGRPLPTMCSLCRPPGSGIHTGPCATDADCTDGENGRCIFASRTSACDYDGCFKDEDCATGEICECDGSRGGGNICVPANCITDDDCGGFECSPTLGSCGHYTPPTAYRCHTVEDGCTIDADCAAVSDEAYCAFDESIGSWQCSTLECVS